MLVDHMLIAKPELIALLPQRPLICNDIHDALYMRGHVFHGVEKPLLCIIDIVKKQTCQNNEQYWSSTRYSHVVYRVGYAKSLYLTNVNYLQIINIGRDN